MVLEFLRVIRSPLSPQTAALRVICERLFEFLAVFECFAYRETEVQPIGMVQARVPKLCSHPFEKFVVDAMCLQVGEAPVRFTVMGCEFDRLSIRGDTVVTAPDRLQHVPEARPYCGLVRVFFQQFFTDTDRRIVFEHADQDGGLEFAAVDVPRILGQHLVHRFERLLHPALPQQHDRMVVSCAEITRRKIQAPCE